MTGYATPFGFENAPPRARVRTITAARTVYLGIAAWTAVFSALVAVRHEAFGSGRFDLGNMTQAVANTANGRFLETTAASGEQFTRLGAHADPLLAVFALPWLVWPSPLLLVTVQALALALGALPVFWLARKHLGSDAAAARFALAYLVYPATQWNAHADFHAVSLAIPLLLFAIWYLDEDRLWAFLPFALAAAAAKEHVPLLIACLGGWYLLRGGRRRAGAAIVAIGLAWFAVASLLVVPHFAPEGASLLAGRYDAFGGSPAGVFEALVTDPGVVASELVTAADATYLVLLLAPVLALCYREPLLLLCAAPQLGLDLLSGKEEQISITFHYSAGAAPFVIAAAVLGAARLRPHTLGLVSRGVLAASLGFGLVSPLLFAPAYARALASPVREARVEALALVPADAAVATTNKLGGHASERRYVFSVPRIRSADWIALDRADPTLGDVEAPEHFARFVRSLERDPRWRKVFDREGVLVFERRRASSPRA
jgi:uncharacterized membrane protein